MKAANVKKDGKNMKLIRNPRHELKLDMLVTMAGMKHESP